MSPIDPYRASYLAQSSHWNGGKQTLPEGQNVPYHPPAVPAAATRSGGVVLAARRPSRLLNQLQYLLVAREAAEPVEVRVDFDPRLGLVIGVRQ